MGTADGSREQSASPGASERPAPTASPDTSALREPSRRALLLGAGVAGGGALGAALGFAGGWTSAAQAAGVAAPAVTPAAGGPAGAGDTATTWAEPGGQAGRVAVSTPVGTDTVPFHGRRQAGVETSGQAHAVMVALTLRPETDRGGVQRMLRLLSDDAARLTQGRATLADTEPELAPAPARMTVTFGFGPALLDLVAPDRRPAWLRPLPAYGIDRLQDRYCGGDLLLWLSGDDPVSLSHARRMLLKDARAFARVHWVQTGFRSARGAHPRGTTMRNLFGQVDGTTNPAPGSEAMERIVWGQGTGESDLSPWIPDGTSLVLRRIAMDLDAWDMLDRPGKELVIGRRLDTGAPLTGREEHDVPDLAARNDRGFPVISDVAHIRRARTERPDEAMLRQAYNYDDGPGADTDPSGTAPGDAVGVGSGAAESPVSAAGLLFAAYQCDVDRQYVPVQARLAESDHLNLWTTPIGSAVFAIPPGCDEGGYVGDVLFD